MASESKKKSLAEGLQVLLGRLLLGLEGLGSAAYAVLLYAIVGMAKPKSTHFQNHLS